MAYELKRTPPITVELTIGDEAVEINISVDDFFKKYQALFNTLNASEAKIQESAPDEIEEYFEKYKEDANALFLFVYGKENTVKVMDFFDGNYFEAMISTFDFLNSEVVPKITKIIDDAKVKKAAKYKKV